MTINPHVGANPIEDFQDWAGLQVEGLIDEINCFFGWVFVSVCVNYDVIVFVALSVLTGPAQGGSQAAQRAARH